LLNIVFCDEIDAEEIPGLYAQCHVGLIALDIRHRTHNIPGKFLSYMQAGLPVMAILNPGNDLEEIIKKYRVGKATTDRSQNKLRLLAESIICDISILDDEISCRCKRLAFDLFSSKMAAEQIGDALNLEG
jgi:hypothetical protein